MARLAFAPSAALRSRFVTPVLSSPHSSFCSRPPNSFWPPLNAKCRPVHHPLSRFTATSKPIQNSPARALLTPGTARPMLALVTVFLGSFTVVCRFFASPTSIPSLAIHPTLNPLVFNILRLVISGLLSVIVLARARLSRTAVSSSLQSRPTLAAGRWRVFFAGMELGIWNVSINVAVVTALAFTAAPRVAFLAQLQTILVPLASLFLIHGTNDTDSEGDRASLQIAAARIIPFALIALAGSALLSLDGDALRTAGASMLSLGDTLAILSSVFATIYYLRSQSFVRADLPSAELTAVKNIAQGIFACLHLAATAGPACLLGWKNRLLAVALLSPTALLLNVSLVIYAGVFVNFFGAWVQMSSLEFVPASDAALIFAFAPVVTAAVAALVMGEVLGPWGMAGAVLILFSSIGTVVFGAKNRRRKKAV